MEKVGVIHGRFQPPHKDHILYIMAAKKRCEFLYVGVSNPDPSAVRPDDADPHRSDPHANPLTYHERLILLTHALREEGVDDRSFCIVPFPINYPDRLRHYVPMDAVFYMTIYDEWGEKKLGLFKDLGVHIEVMWKKAQKGITGTAVRDAIARGEPWEDQVPPVVASLMKEMRLLDRIKGT